MEQNVKSITKHIYVNTRTCDNNIKKNHMVEMTTTYVEI